MSHGARGMFLRFCAVGAFGLVVDVAVLYLAAPLCGWYLARGLSFLAAATATWALNRRYTFSAAQHPQPLATVLRQYLSYLLTMVLGGTANYLVYVATLRWLAVPAAPLVGVVLGSATGLVFNFLSARYLVFRRH